MGEKDQIYRIGYYIRKTREFLSLSRHERNSLRGERLMQYKEAMNERLKKSLEKR